MLPCRAGRQTFGRCTGQGEHILMMLKLFSCYNADLVSSCILFKLLGGEGSFLAGGPSKVIYTRLYSQVLNQYPQVTSAIAFNCLLAFIIRIWALVLLRFSLRYGYCWFCFWCKCCCWRRWWVALAFHVPPCLVLVLVFTTISSLSLA